MGVTGIYVITPFKCSIDILTKLQELFIERYKESAFGSV